MRDASTIQYSGFKKLRSDYIHPSSLVTPYELAILNKNVEQRRDEHTSASSNARGNLNSFLDPPCWREQNAGLEHTRMEVIWTEYRQVDGTEHPARFRTYEVQICQISFCEDALSIARTADRVTNRVATL